MGTVPGTGDIITAGTAGIAGNAEEHRSAWWCRENVWQGKPRRLALTRGNASLPA